MFLVQLVCRSSPFSLTQEEDLLYYYTHHFPPSLSSNYTRGRRRLLLLSIFAVLSLLLLLLPLLPLLSLRSARGFTAYFRPERFPDQTHFVTQTGAHLSGGGRETGGLSRSLSVSASGFCLTSLSRRFASLSRFLSSLRFSLPKAIFMVSPDRPIFGRQHTHTFSLLLLHLPTPLLSLLTTYTEPILNKAIFLDNKSLILISNCTQITTCPCFCPLFLELSQFEKPAPWHLILAWPRPHPIISSPVRLVSLGPVRRERVAFPDKPIYSTHTACPRGNHRRKGQKILLNSTSLSQFFPVHFSSDPS